jgi:hypothetical protein
VSNHPQITWRCSSYPQKCLKRPPPKHIGGSATPKSHGACLVKERNFSLPLFTFFKNNQFQNILTLYHINNFLLLFKLKKFITIQNFFTFLYKFFLLYITFITSYYYSQLPLPYQTRPWGWWPFLLFFLLFFFFQNF